MNMNSTRSATWCTSRIKALLRFLEKKLYDYAEENFDQYEVEGIRRSSKGEFEFRYSMLPNIRTVSNKLICLEDLGPDAEEAYALLGELADMSAYMHRNITSMATTEKEIFSDDGDMFDKIIEKTIGTVVMPNKLAKKKGAKK